LIKIVIIRWPRDAALKAASKSNLYKIEINGKEEMKEEIDIYLKEVPALNEGFFFFFFFFFFFL